MMLLQLSIYFHISWWQFLNADTPYEVVDPAFASGFPAQEVPDHIQRPSYASHCCQEKPPYQVLIKNASEIASISKSCSLVKLVFKSLEDFVRAGRTTEEIDAYAHRLIIQNDAYPSPLKYWKFPKSICTSVNNVAIHGIPDNRTLRNGDIITIDVSVFLNGYHGDGAETFLVGEVDDAGKRLVQGAREILHALLECCRPGECFSAMCDKIKEETQKRDLHNMVPYIGHGVGRFLHERPHINCSSPIERAEKMVPGMVLAIEPLIGESNTDCMAHYDNITIMTIDNSRTAQFEHTILITNESYQILT